LVNAIETYRNWLKNVSPDSEIYKDLVGIENSNEEIQSRFEKEIEFGTAGIRGIMAAGTNRINVHVISRICHAASLFLNENFTSPSVAIAYDTRKNSQLFAKTAAAVFGSYGVKVLIFGEPQPTPLLSFAIRNLGCSIGAVITASHNTAEYNGFKLYDSDGAQFCDVSEICKELAKINFFEQSVSFDENLKLGKIKYIKESVAEDYKKEILKFCIFRNLDLNVIYSPLNGCAGKIFIDILQKIGVKNLEIVETQTNLDGNFSSCPIPNPEKKESYGAAISLAEKNNSDLIILNDPDGDRVGAAVKFENGYEILSANELAALFLYYFIVKNLQENYFENKIIIKSIVSGGLPDAIASKYKINIIETFPGFKYMGREILNLEKNGTLPNFLMAFEESNGFLFAPYVRDKDGICAAALLCGLVSYFKQKNINLIDILSNLYEEFGYFSQKTFSVEVKNGFQVNCIIEKIKKNKKKFKDLLSSDYNSNILTFKFKGGQKLIIRPSGTESLFKFYVLTNGERKKTELFLKNIKGTIDKILGT
jgi:phosphoglucomutase